MGAIFLNCFIDTIIFLWFIQKHGNNKAIFLKMTVTYLGLVGGTVLLNQFQTSGFLYRIFFSFIIYFILTIMFSEKKKWKESAARTALFMFCLLISEFVISIIVMIIAKNSDLEMLMQNTFVGTFALLSTRTMEIVFLHLIKAVFEERIVKVREIKWHILCILGIIAYLYIVIYCFVQNKIDYSILGIAFISNIIFLALTLIIYFVYLNTMKNLEIQKKEIGLLKEKTKNEVDYYREIDALHQEMKKIYHDLKNHILIADTIEKASLKEEYMESLHEYFKDYLLTINSGNDILDILLQKKFDLCKEKGIEFTFNVDFSKGDFVNLIDVGSIFGNIIDNAIEACATLNSNKKKEISLYVGAMEGFIVIKIINPFEKILKKEGILFSIKRGNNEQGLGLKSLRDVLEKYSGTYNYEIKERQFELTILLPIRQ